MSLFNHPLLSSLHKRTQHWKGRNEFMSSQIKILAVLLLALLGNLWPYAYPRNDNHNMLMFWTMNAALLIAAVLTLHDDSGSSRGTILSRAQTEEWKGWMQWAFIMYHYYRAYPVYNEIRVFVSAYVWMTGFGNFLYFDKKQDFSIERVVSMWLRINYFPLLLSLFLNVKLELYYVVPLHTVGFFITFATCAFSRSKFMDRMNSNTRWNTEHRNAVAIGLCLLVHVLFYETPMVNLLKWLFSEEISFRFQSDKYTAWVGILSGFFWKRITTLMQWALSIDTAVSLHHDTDPVDDNIAAGQQKHTEPTLSQKLHPYALWLQRAAGLFLIVVWYMCFGSITDKYVYNPIHPYVFWLPVAGWLLIRNSSVRLIAIHSAALEWLGRITLETYVLQFHLFMTRDVQYIPIVIPGSGPDGHLVLRTINMLVCGVVFVAVAFWARQITISTQTTVTELVHVLVHGPPAGAVTDGDDNTNEETVALTKEASPTSDPEIGAQVDTANSIATQ